MPQEIIQAPDWRPPITQQLKNIEKLDHINTHEELGLLSIDTETYFIAEDGLKYRLPNGEVKMCITKEDAHDWVKMVHEHKEPHLTIEEVLTQVNEGPY